MAEPGTGNTFFSIPELVALLSEYLSLRDIARCMATSKNCARLFEPYLWRHITKKHSGASRNVVRRNRHHAVSLIIGNNVEINARGYLGILAGRAPSTPSIPSGPVTSISAHHYHHRRDGSRHRPLDLSHITVLAVSPKISRSDHRNILYKIITQCRRLKTLVFPLPSFHKNRLQLLAHILETQSSLRTLTITGKDSCYMRDFTLLLELCMRHPTIKDLRCRFNLFQQDANADLWGRFSGVSSQLKSLVMPTIGNRYWTSEFLPPILHACGPNLERLQIIGIYGNVADKLEQTLRNHCPNIQHIRCSLDHSYSVERNKAVLELIRGSVGRGLVSFHAGYPSVDQYQFDTSNRDVLKALLDNHSTTLEELQIDAVRSAASWEQAEILARCSMLKRFWIVPARYGVVSVEISHLLHSEWACLGLRELYLTLDRRTTGPVQEPIVNLVHRVYAQIGRLRKLEKLSLGCYTFRFGGGNEGNSEMDLTLNSGFLAKLEGLSQLNEFAMTSDYWTFMGQAEVEFMDWYWPKLRKITFGSPTRAVGMRDYGATRRPHWQWLRSKRQLLEYNVHRPPLDLVYQVLA